MPIARLPRGRWTYDEAALLGRPGGFGSVFRGHSEDGAPVAIKRLHVNATHAAHRELRIAQEFVSRSFSHVMPVLDSGQDAESEAYFVVMPIADESLEDLLGRDGPMKEIAAMAVLLQIARGLQEVPDVVHRDLKPANVLKYGDRWCIADFGIARFVQESTSASTLKDFLSPMYAAPEQWLLQRVTSATDIYALGCIAHALLTGRPPFVGDQEELRRQHLTETPADPPQTSPRLRTLLSMMLRKPADARPSAQRVIAVLEWLDVQPLQPDRNAVIDRLANVAAAHERQRSIAESARHDAAREQERRKALAAQARTILEDVFDRLAKYIVSDVPNASVERKASVRGVAIATGKLELDLGTLDALAADAFPRSRWDVITKALIRVEQQTPKYYRRSASLWYTRRADPKSAYRWYEAAYEANPLSGRFQYQPCAQPPEQADLAHGPGMATIQESYPPEAIDDEDIEAFCWRWAHLFAVACEGGLEQLPTSLPRP